MSDLIDRDEVIEIIDSVCSADDTYWKPGTLEKIRNLPTHPTPSNTLGALDCVSREDLTKEIETYFGDLPIAVHYDMLALAQKLPSAQPSPCEFCKHNNIADGKACLRCSAERRTDE